MLFDDHEDSTQSHSNNMQHQIIHILTISPGHIVIPFHPPKYPVIFTLGIAGGTLELYLLWSGLGSANSCYNHHWGSCLSPKPMQWGAKLRCGFKCTELCQWPAPCLSHTYLVRWGRLRLLLLTWSEAWCLAPAGAQAWPSVVAVVVATWGWEGMGCALCLGYSRWAAGVGTEQNMHGKKKTQTGTISCFWKQRVC